MRSKFINIHSLLLAPNDVFYFVLSDRYHVGAAVGRNRLADLREARREGDLPAAADSGADVRRLHLLADDVARVQHVPHPAVHSVRLQDPQDSRELQRGQVHWLHHVQHLHRVARLRAHLLWHQQRLQGHNFTQNNFMLSFYFSCNF